MADPNPDSLTPAQGEFKPRRERDEPLMTGGHQPGKLVGNDAVPESHLEILPAGSAPADKSYEPNPISETPGQADNASALRSHGKESTFTSAEDTLGGATSADVHQGYGHPGQGQTSSELRQGGTHGSGLEGRTTVSSGPDSRYDASQRALDRDDATTGTRGDKGILGAEERLPESAESVAAERS